MVWCLEEENESKLKNVKFIKREKGHFFYIETKPNISSMYLTLLALINSTVMQPK